MRVTRAIARAVPGALGVIGFALVGVGEAHAAPLWAPEVLADGGGLLDSARGCVENLSLSLLWDLTPHGAADAAGACGSLRGVGFALLGLAAIVVIALGRMRLATEHKRLDVARRLVEQGMDPPAELLMGPARNDLRRGIVLMFAGAGLFAAGVVGADRAMSASGLIPEFIGLGYLLSYWLAARDPRSDRSEDGP